MFIPQRLRRNILPWLCAVVFVANFLCADGGLDVAWPRSVLHPRRAHSDRADSALKTLKRYTSI